MERQTVSTDRAPKAIGPYSQAVKAESSRLVFCSGQISIDPETNSFVEGDIRRQTEQVLTNLKALLEAAGSSLKQAVKITAFLRNMEDYTAFNETYARFFGEDAPARAVVEVSGLPKSALLEMDAVAILD